MNDSFPAWHLTLTEFWDPSCRSVTAFNHGECLFPSKFFTGWKIDAVVITNLTEIDVELPNCRFVQPRCTAAKFALLNVGSKHETAQGNTTRSECAMPEKSLHDSVTPIDPGFHGMLKAMNKVTRRQHDPRGVGGIIANLHRRWQMSLDNLMSCFVDTSCVLIVWLWLKCLCVRTVIERRNAHADGNGTCQRSQLPRIIGLSRHCVWMIERCSDRMVMVCRMTGYHLSDFGTHTAQVVGQMLSDYKSRLVMVE